MPARPDVLVVGAGISGLSSALCLARCGMTVEVQGRELPLQTTSCAAAAMWAPYQVTDSRLMRWSADTYRELARFGPDAGVRHVPGREVSRTRQNAPRWMRQLPGYRTCRRDEVPEGFATGWRYETPVIDMPVYLTALLTELGDLKVPVRQLRIGSFDDALGQAPIVVNCTGAGARELVPDEGLTTSRGQLVVVENPGIDEFFAEHEESTEPTYFLPHGDRLVLGGSAESGRTDLEPDPSIAAAIRRRCGAIEPMLHRARVLAHRVGLRPTRVRVRLERVRDHGRHLIHNYGHGGAGVTLSWGCARDVRRLAEEVL
jgi:D-amino-acid oxidase